jgi:hypothetical protein
VRLELSAFIPPLLFTGGDGKVGRLVLDALKRHADAGYAISGPARPLAASRKRERGSRREGEI